MLTITSFEYRAIVSLASLFSLRMLGLFMILPVFAVYAHQLNHVTPTTIGIALGVYGLTQALLQIPFGIASDRFGRKPLILLGLLFFILGSIIAALSGSIYGVIIGRSLQGASAIGCVVMALVADLTREEIRVRAMAVLGITIGVSFILALLLGPLLSEWTGVRGIFWITAGLAIVAICILVFWVPTPLRQSEVDSLSSSFWTSLPKIFRESELNLLNFGVLVLHASLTALFLKIPLMVEALGYSGGTIWRFYPPILIGSLLATAPCIMVIEKKRWFKAGIAALIITLALSELGILLFFNTWGGLAVSLGLFFTAFNTLEASLPSLVSKFAPTGCKGAALGVYSSAQFFGLFLGGIMGGWLDAAYGMVGVLVFCIMLAVVWLTWFCRKCVQSFA